MSAPAPTIRTRKFLTNRLMGRKQFVRATHSPSLRRALQLRLGRCWSPEQPPPSVARA